MTKPHAHAFLCSFLVVAGCARAPARTALQAAPQVAQRPDSSGALSPSVAGPPRVDTATAATAADSIVIPPAEITRIAADVFGDSVAPKLSPVDSMSGPTWDIDVRSYETREQVQRYVALFSGPARDRIGDRLSQGSRYDAMIRSKLRGAGLPQDMSFLALVESGYDPHAYSRAAAVGMWQFMASTARGAGLRVDWWVDERRDPVRSTDAAVKFLSWLREEFGSLYLAAAAYNGGPGRVARGLTRFAGDLEGTSGEDVFFALAEKDYLPRDTKNYVPQIIAVALIAREPARYGLRLEQRPPFVYDSVIAPASTPLAAIARATGVDLGDIRELNPHLLRGVTPPNDAILIRLPVGQAEGFDVAFKALDASERRAFTRVTTRKADRLATIARRHSLSTKQLGWYNPRISTLKGGALKVGQTILVPSSAVVEAAMDVPNPSVEIYGRSTRASARAGTHRVQRGESLSTIARKYRTTVDALVRLNRLSGTRINAGQTLRIR